MYTAFICDSPNLDIKNTHTHQMPAEEASQQQHQVVFDFNTRNNRTVYLNVNNIYIICVRVYWNVITLDMARTQSKVYQAAWPRAERDYRADIVDNLCSRTEPPARRALWLLTLPLRLRGVARVRTHTLNQARPPRRDNENIINTLAQSRMLDGILISTENTCIYGWVDRLNRFFYSRRIADNLCMYNIESLLKMCTIF